ncbi:MAG: hypothetical protein AVDCRST_MAG89-1844, partial [uncultured Gemmatimonadetes bacterium]
AFLCGVRPHYPPGRVRRRGVRRRPVRRHRPLDRHHAGGYLPLRVRPGPHAERGGDLRDGHRARRRAVGRGAGGRDLRLPQRGPEAERAGVRAADLRCGVPAGHHRAGRGEHAGRAAREPARHHGIADHLGAGGRPAGHRARHAV